MKKFDWRMQLFRLTTGDSKTRLGNIAWLTADKIIRLSVGLFVGAWIARYLGPTEFGIYSFAIAFSSVFATVAAFGLRTIVVRQLVKEPDSENATIGSAALLLFASGILAYVTMSAAIALLRPHDQQMIALVMIIGGAVMFKSSEVAVYYFEAKTRSRHSVVAQNIAILMFAGLKILLLLAESSLEHFARALTAEAAVAGLLLFNALNRHGLVLRQLSARLGVMKEMLRDAWPLGLSGMIVIIQARTDQLMLGEMLGPTELGYYSAALRLIEAAAILSGIVYSTFLPSLIKAKTEGPEQYRLSLSNYFRLNSAVALGLAIPIAILSPVIITVIFGSQYAPSAAILGLMSVRLILAHLGVARSIYLLNEGLMKHGAASMAISTVLNVGLNYLLIPSYASMGAVAASIISFLTGTVILDLIRPATRREAIFLLRNSVALHPGKMAH